MLHLYYIYLLHFLFSELITTEKWKKAVDMVIREVEDVFWEKDGVGISQVEPLIISLTHDGKCIEAKE